MGKAEKKIASTGATASMGAPCGVEDRNRTASFPFCGNRFEFRAVGSSQNCSFPITIVNTVMAAGMKNLADLIEGGKSHRDAVAEMFKQNRDVIFTGNGYSAEWPEEAKKRGLPNLNTTPLAIDAFTEPKMQDALASMNVMSKDESSALAETMYENYITTLSIEVQTMLNMVQTGFMPAFAKDIIAYKEVPELLANRRKLYCQVQAEADTLKRFFEHMGGSLKDEAAYLCNKVKPQMDVLRKCVDDAEKLMDKSNYPYPTY